MQRSVGVSEGVFVPVTDVITSATYGSPASIFFRSARCLDTQLDSCLNSARPLGTYNNTKHTQI